MTAVHSIGFAARHEAVAHFSHRPIAIEDSDIGHSLAGTNIFASLTPTIYSGEFIALLGAPGGGDVWFSRHGPSYFSNDAFRGGRWWKKIALGLLGRKALRSRAEASLTEVSLDHRSGDPSASPNRGLDDAGMFRACSGQADSSSW